MDYGCGAGEPLEWIAEIFNRFNCEVELYGVDINQANLAIAKKENPGVQFHLITKDVFALDISDFDLVMCNFVLLENSLEDIGVILKNINQLLNVDGISIITHNRSKVYDYNKGNEFVSFETNFYGEPALF